MSNNTSLPTLSVSVTVIDNNGSFSASFDPNPVPVAGVAVRLHYTLETADWAFDGVDFSAPFSDLDIISPTEFEITDNGGDQGSFSFSLRLIQTLAHRGEQPAQIETEPEILNGPQ